ncbi:MAG: hypothetical protein L6266_01270 [Nanoarchaeota archaeon]|nr:hypothetical protein [Nanoarchaeota archaeon]
MGSACANFCVFKSSVEDAYILGLWCADGYWWSSSFGLSNMDEDLINKFRIFFNKHFLKTRIKFDGSHIFVNSRPLLREFRAARAEIDKLEKTSVIKAYFAGRFDGDGSVSKDLRSNCRIVYSNKKETEIDKLLLEKIKITNTKIYYYKTARTFCLYISRYEAKKFFKKILMYSVKIQKLVHVAP